MTTTAFEQRVAAEAQPDWCSVAEETTFINALDTASARVHVYSAGKSVENRDLWAVEVYNGASIVGRPVVLVVGLQHGLEGASREGALQFMRDLALSEDAGITAYLDLAAWVFLPTTNPDRSRIWNDGTRLNANGANLNSRHFVLAEPEAQIIQEAITVYAPVIGIDAHEMSTNPTQGMEFNRMLHTETDASARSDADEIVVLLRNAITSLGFAQGIFASSSPNRATLLNSGGLRHAIMVLFESRRPTSPDEANMPRANRVAMQVRSLEVVRDYHIANLARLTEQRDASVTNAVGKGIRGESYDLQNGTTVSPAGYKLTSAQWDAVAVVAETFELRSYPRGNDVIVYMGQPARGIIPMIFDPLVTSADAGTPIGSAERLVELPVPYVKLGAVTHDDAEFILGGSPRTVSFRTWA